MRKYTDLQFSWLHYTASHNSSKLKNVHRICTCKQV